MKVLIYKRTHKGDPDEGGIFGIQDCMGKIRNWKYDAVIGIGGNAPWKEDSDIRHKLNWVGIKPIKINSKFKRGSLVAFSHFQLFEEEGLDLHEFYPQLFKYMFCNRKRFSMSSELPIEVFDEVEQILNSVKACPPSKNYVIDSENDKVDNLKIECTKGCFNEKNIELDLSNC